MILYTIHTVFDLQKLKLKRYTFRNFAGMDISHLQEDTLKTDWQAIDRLESVVDQVNLLNSYLVQLYDVHAPVKHLPAPWLNDEVRSLMDKKTRAKNKYKNDVTERNRERYRETRNLCNTKIRDIQRRHIHQSVENGDPAKVWSFLN